MGDKLFFLVVVFVRLVVSLMTHDLLVEYPTMVRSTSKDFPKKKHVTKASSGRAKLEFLFTKIGVG